MIYSESLIIYAQEVGTYYIEGAESKCRWAWSVVMSSFSWFDGSDMLLDPIRSIHGSYRCDVLPIMMVVIPCLIYPWNGCTHVPCWLYLTMNQYVDGHKFLNIWTGVVRNYSACQILDKMREFLVTGIAFLLTLEVYGQPNTCPVIFRVSKQKRKSLACMYLLYIAYHVTIQ